MFGLLLLHCCPGLELDRRCVPADGDANEGRPNGRNGRFRLLCSGVLRWLLLILFRDDDKKSVFTFAVGLFFVSACRLLRGLALPSPPPLRLVESRELGTSAGSDHAATAGGGVTFRSIVNHCIDIIVSSSWCTHNANDIVWY